MFMIRIRVGSFAFPPEVISTDNLFVPAVLPIYFNKQSYSTVSFYLREIASRKSF